MNTIIVIGGAHIDRKGEMSGDYIQGSSIPGLITESTGGGAYNVAANLANLGWNIQFISPRASDMGGKTVTESIESHANISDMPVKCAGNTPSYTALIDKHGELIAALADMQLYDDQTAETFLTIDVETAVKACKILVTDANLSEDIMQKIALILPPSAQWFAIAVSPAKITRYRSVLNRINCLAMNRNEAHALTGSDEIPRAISELKKMGLDGAIITNGAEPATCYMTQSEPVQVTPLQAKHIQDVTGAGDATLSGFISALQNGYDTELALKHGIAAAQLTISVKGAQNPHLSKKLIQQTLHTSQT